MHDGADERTGFDRRGVLALRGLLSADDIAALRAGCDAPLWSPDDPAGLPGFACLADAPHGTVFAAIADEPRLRTRLRALAGQRLILTGANRFHVSTELGGSPWHFDRATFCSIQPLDPGFSLWIPLEPIEPREQHGGIVWVPGDVWDARGRYQQWAGHLRRGPGAPDPDALAAALQRQFGPQRGFPMLGEYDRAFLELHAETSGFAVGDALFFTKFLWHRTAPMRPGALVRRTAVVLRFVGESATLARDLMLAATRDLDDSTRRAHGIFGSFFHDIPDGAAVASSRFAAAPH